MSELWICREQTARVPYRMEIPGVEITTIEELCYYLYHSMEYVDESVMGEPLFAWLSGELKLPRLAEALREERSRGRTAFWCAWFLLKEIGMYNQEELSQFQDLCLKLEQKDEAERKKLKADRMLAQERCEAAVREYRQLLFREQEEENPQLLGAACHNLGVAYARLFLFDEAAKAFEKAYGYNQNLQSFEALREALKLSREQRKAPEMITESDKDATGGQFPALEQLKNDYRKKVN